MTAAQSALLSQRTTKWRSAGTRPLSAARWTAAATARSSNRDMLTRSRCNDSRGGSFHTTRVHRTFTCALRLSPWPRSRLPQRPATPGARRSVSGPLGKLPVTEDVTMPLRAVHIALITAPERYSCARQTPRRCTYTVHSGKTGHRGRMPKKVQSVDRALCRLVPTKPPPPR